MARRAIRAVQTVHTNIAANQRVEASPATGSAQVASVAIMMIASKEMPASTAADAIVKARGDVTRPDYGRFDTGVLIFMSLQGDHRHAPLLAQR